MSLITSLTISNLTSGFAVTLVALVSTLVLFSFEVATTALVTLPSLTTKTVKVNLALAPFPANESIYQTLVSLSQLPSPVALVTTTRLDNFSVTYTSVAVDLPLLITVIMYSIESPTLTELTLATLLNTNSTFGFAVTLVALVSTSVSFSLALATTALVTLPSLVTKTVNVKVASLPLSMESICQILLLLFHLPSPVASVTTTRPDNFSVTLTSVAVDLPLLTTVIV